ncbi:hypothetical protein ATI02_4320 [Pseudomonas baetica]|uniref:CdiI immunity protein domain-containing protein n=1 Tax=Pseudomonas baetica TaxID=674054 RepID=A0ABX4Q3J3_9PSED|nr:hypothetical protein [Pseudomonas baetica]PKA71342.1 hypothetical protein ATI02_4320 [Pseudomonas baetica]PTC19841.1 hypothetical protein C0J26_07540 [Pseudomonas baetica]
MNKEYYTEEDAFELTGLSFEDYIDFELGNLKFEHEILPELLIDDEQDMEDLIKKLNEVRR